MNHTASVAINGKTLAIGVLTVTACIFFVGLILVSQPPAYAIGQLDRGGDYIMLTQQLSTTTEGIVVIDAAAKQMIVYQYDYNNRSLDILKRVYLDQLPKPNRPAETEQRPTPGRRP
jgi:hypothetical protein